MRSIGVDTRKSPHLPARATSRADLKGALLRKATEVQPGEVLKPEEAIRDPFVLEFLDLKDEYSEPDLEAALIQRLTDFLPDAEIGNYVH